MAAVKLGFAPTRRSIFSAPDAVKYRGLTAARLRELVPPECVYVVESGVSSTEDVAALKKAGADAVLMGEVLMRAKDKAALLREMREAAR